MYLRFLQFLPVFCTIVGGVLLRPFVQVSCPLFSKAGQQLLLYTVVFLSPDWAPLLRALWLGYDTTSTSVVALDNKIA